MESIKSSDKSLVYGNGLIIFFCFYFGVAAIFDFFSNFKVAGLSFFVTIIPYLALIFITVKNFKVLNKVHCFLYGMISIIFVLIVFFRSIFFDENFIVLLGANRFILFVPILFLLFEKLNFNLSNLNIPALLLSVLIIHATNSLFYMLGLPFIEHVDVLADDYVPLGRLGGIMGGANVQAVFTSSIYLIMILSNWRISFPKFLFITFIAIIAVLPTVSKGGALVVFFGVIYYIFKNLLSGGFVTKIGIVVLIILMIFLLITLANSPSMNLFTMAFTGRLEDDDLSSGRWDRLDYFWQIINQDWRVYFIGVPGVLLTQGGNDVSDNIFTLLPVNFGVIYTLIFLSFLANFIRLRYQTLSSNVNLYLFVILIISLVNNSIIWTAWTYYAVFGFYYILYKNKIDNHNLPPN